MILDHDWFPEIYSFEIWWDSFSSVQFNSIDWSHYFRLCILPTQSAIKSTTDRSSRLFSTCERRERLSPSHLQWTRLLIFGHYRRKRIEQCYMFLSLYIFWTGARMSLSSEMFWSMLMNEQYQALLLFFKTLHWTTLLDDSIECIIYPPASAWFIRETKISAEEIV